MLKKLIKSTASITIALLCCVFLGCSSSNNINLDEAKESETTLEVNEDNAQIRREYLQKYRFDDSVNQLLIVSHTEGWNATASFYVKQKKADAWTLVFVSDAYIGKDGMGETNEDCCKTPCGDYEITGAFGILDNPGTSLDYINVTSTTFACSDDCEYYNQIIDTQKTDHNCQGEEMFLYSPEYNYGLTTSYNSENIYPNGSAIFVHCKGQKPFTGGCIALDEKDMETMLKSADKGMRIYLDEYYNSVND